MATLSQQEHWDGVHKGEEESLAATSEPVMRGTRSLRKRVAQVLKGLLGDDLVRGMSSYDEYLLWDVIFPRHLPELRGTKVLEVGSAPGEFLVKFGRKYQCTPYGVEYSERGVALNKRVFSSSGFPPENVIYADFFSPEFQERHRGFFDVVISRGFIEHFTDVESVLQKHMNLLRPGGYLVMSIPNLQGVNYALVRLFHKEVIDIHNLKIMQKEAFARLFETTGVQRLFCDYYGTFSFCLFNVKEGSAMRHALALSHRLQPVLNLAFHSIFRDKSMESAAFSPSLLFIGRNT
jgi:2-polyprenyl-3-methyl-5-hydroxy-6-metoxy-1,4-benzoquinol methylase